LGAVIDSWIEVYQTPVGLDPLIVLRRMIRKTGALYGCPLAYATVRMVVQHVLTAAALDNGEGHNSTACRIETP